MSKRVCKNPNFRREKGKIKFVGISIESPNKIVIHSILTIWLNLNFDIKFVTYDFSFWSLW